MSELEKRLDALEKLMGDLCLAIDDLACHAQTINGDITYWSDRLDECRQLAADRFDEEHS